MKHLFILVVAVVMNFSAAFAETTIPVNFIILQESTGQGNEIWAKNNDHINLVLSKINSDFYKTTIVELKLGAKKIIRDSRLYNSPMSDGSNPLIEVFGDNALEKKGAILVVIAREQAVDVNGRAERQGYDYSPVFIMRSVRNSLDPNSSSYIGGAAAIRTDAGLFVHEMGHMMDLRHGDRASLSPNTENYTANARGIEIYKKYFSQMAGYNAAGSTSPGTISGSGSLSGGLSSSLRLSSY